MKEKIEKLTEYFCKHFNSEIYVEFADISNFDIWKIIDKKTDKILIFCSINNFDVEECYKNSSIDNLIKLLLEELDNEVN